MDSRGPVQREPQPDDGNPELQQRGCSPEQQRDGRHVQLELQHGCAQPGKLDLNKGRLTRHGRLQPDPHGAGEWQQFGSNADRPVEAALGSGTASKDAGSDAVGFSTYRSLDAAIGSGTALEDAGSETGVPTRTSPAAPTFLQSCPSPTVIQFWFMPPPKNFDRSKFDCRV